MEVKSDIEIAQAANVRPIQEIAEKLNIPADALIPYGHDKAKISAEFIKSTSKAKDGKLILVPAVSPTPAATSPASRPPWANAASLTTTVAAWLSDRACAPVSCPRRWPRSGSETPAA